MIGWVIIMDMEKEQINEETFQRTQMQKERIIQKLKERGARITKQRLALLDIILEEECTCCKEIYYKASKANKKIGSATVYRMINTLEEIGAISRKNMYKIADDESDIAAAGTELVLTETPELEICTIAFDDDTVVELPINKLSQVIRTGLTACGYHSGHTVSKVILSSSVS